MTASVIVLKRQGDDDDLRDLDRTIIELEAELQSALAEREAAFAEITGSISAEPPF